MSTNFKIWLKAACIRATKTVAQTALACIGTSTVMGDINWVVLISTSFLSGLMSILTSICGLPEVDVYKEVNK